MGGCVGVCLLHKREDLSVDPQHPHRGILGALLISYLAKHRAPSSVKDPDTPAHTNTPMRTYSLQATQSFKVEMFLVRISV